MILRLIGLLFLLVLPLFGTGQVSDDETRELLVDLLGDVKPHQMSEIERVNDSIVLVAGYLQDPFDDRSILDKPQDVIFKSTDGGQTWRVIHFDGDAWIYCVDAHSDGQVWMGGSDEVVHYSTDFGETWKQLRKPFRPNDRVLSLYMIDAQNGIAGGLSGGLAVTDNNWKTSRQIDSPLDQGKFRITKNSARDRINQLAVFDSLMVIDQNNYIFYSRIDPIDWRKFPIPVSAFSVDRETKEIDLHSRDGKHFIIDSDLHLLRSYQEPSLFPTHTHDTSRIDISDFTKHPVQSVEVVSTVYELDRQVHMSAFWRPVVERVFYEPNGENWTRTFKGKTKEQYHLIPSYFSDVLTAEKMGFPLSGVAAHLRFSEPDHGHLERLIEAKVAERRERSEWGGNFTSQITPDHLYFSQYHLVSDSVSQAQLDPLFQPRLVLPLRRGTDHIRVILTNEAGKQLELSNAQASYFSLPWTVKFAGDSCLSFHPDITQFVLGLTPHDLQNVDQLLGGRLLYRLIEERIIRELVYVRPEW